MYSSLLHVCFSFIFGVNRIYIFYVCIRLPVCAAGFKIDIYDKEYYLPPVAAAGGFGNHLMAILPSQATGRRNGCIICERQHSCSASFFINKHGQRGT